MKRKYVRESLDEQWYSTDTGIERYAPYMDKSSNDEQSLDPSQMVPPPTEKFTEESFDEYIDTLIQEVLMESPIFAFNVFREVIKVHPYLNKRPIGFKAQNPYEPTLKKFIETFKTVVNK